MKKKFQIDGSVDLYRVISYLKDTRDDEVTLEFLEDSVVHKNASNLNVIKKHAESLGKTVYFSAEDPTLADYLKMVEEGGNEFSNRPINFDDDIDLPSARSSKKFQAGSMLAGLNIFSKFKKPSLGMHSVSSGMPKTSSNSKAWIYKVGVFAVVIIAILVIGVWSFLTYVPKATVNLKVDSDIFIKLIDVKADSTATTVNLEANTIPAKEIEAEDSETRTIETTGKKQVGEKATGEVEITNETTEKIKIKKGLKFKYKKDNKTLTYLATEDKEIPAASEVTDTNPNEAGDQPGTVYGKGSVKVEAEIFGTDHNVGDDEDFEVEGEDKDEVYAKSNDDIEGGSAKEAKSVSQADLDLLKKTVEEAIKEKFKDTLRRKLSSGQVLSEGSIVITPVKAEYTNKLDDESESLGLTATYAATAFSYEESQLNEVIESNIVKVIPDNFKLSTAKPEYDAIPVKSEEDGILNIQVKLKSLIIPSLDIDKIKQDLAGMKLEAAQNYLNDLPNIQETEIQLTPNLPGPLLRMPKRAANIEIKM